MTLCARGEVTGVGLRIELQTRGAGLVSGLSIYAYVVLVTERLAGYEDNVFGIVLTHTQIVHTVDILWIVTAICFRIVLKSIDAFSYNWFACKAEHILGAGAIVAEGAQSRRGAFGQATHFADIHTLLIAGIKVVAWRATTYDALIG